VEEYHRNVWPEILEANRRVGVTKATFAQSLKGATLRITSIGALAYTGDGDEDPTGERARYPISHLPIAGRIGRYERRP
jgi:hypothetical protein